MVERLIGRLLEEDIGTITLYAEPTVTGLYEKLSFVQDPQGIKVTNFTVLPVQCSIGALRDRPVWDTYGFLSMHLFLL